MSEHRPHSRCKDQNTTPILKSSTSVTGFKKKVRFQMAQNGAVSTSASLTSTTSELSLTTDEEWLPTEPKTPVAQRQQPLSNTTKPKPQPKQRTEKPHREKTSSKSRPQTESGIISIPGPSISITGQYSSSSGSSTTTSSSNSSGRGIPSSSSNSNSSGSGTTSSSSSSANSIGRGTITTISSSSDSSGHGTTSSNSSTNGSGHGNTSSSSNSNSSGSGTTSSSSSADSSGCGTTTTTTTTSSNKRRSGSSKRSNRTRKRKPKVAKVVEDVYEVEAIVGHRQGLKGVEYLIKWKGYSDSDNTWEPVSNMNCWTLLQDYLSKNVFNKTAAEKKEDEEPKEKKEEEEEEEGKQQSHQSSKKEAPAIVTAAERKCMDPPVVMQSHSSSSCSTSSSSSSLLTSCSSEGNFQHGDTHLEVAGSMKLPRRRLNGFHTTKPHPSNSQPNHFPSSDSNLHAQQSPSCVRPQSTPVYSVSSSETTTDSRNSSPYSCVNHSAGTEAATDFVYYCSTHSAISPDASSDCMIVSPLQSPICSPESRPMHCSLDSNAATTSFDLNNSFELNLDSSDSGSISSSNWSIESLVESAPISPSSSVVIIDAPADDEELFNPCSRSTNQCPEDKSVTSTALPSRKNGFASQQPHQKHSKPKPQSSSTMPTFFHSRPTKFHSRSRLPEKENLPRQLNGVSGLVGTMEKSQRFKHHSTRHREPRTSANPRVNGSLSKPRNLSQESNEECYMDRLRKRQSTSSPLPATKIARQGSNAYLPPIVDAHSTVSPVFKCSSVLPLPSSIHPIVVRKQQSEKYRSQLAKWQRQLNTQRSETEAIIYVENEFDEEPIPFEFKYVTGNIYGERVPNPKSSDITSSLCGCNCYNLGKKCSPRSEHCCPHLAASKFAYTMTGKVRVEPGVPIYECNSKCSCPPNCANRVVQRGRKIPLCVFRTPNRGWGVKTVTPIKANTFVTEYAGEVITNKEAERRDRRYQKEGLFYLFDLDFNDLENPAFIIDGTKCGNLSHFFNHSCDPNLVVFSVWIDNLDQRLQRIAFFTTRNVAVGEELTFDYQMAGTSSSGSRVQCLCGAENCIGFLN